MTKPFASIRQLFGRVLGGKSADEHPSAGEYSTLGISTPDVQPFVNGNHYGEGVSDKMAPPELELQTADTQRLPQVAPEFSAPSEFRAAEDDGADEFGDLLLDLGHVRSPKAFAVDDPILDVFDEAPNTDFFNTEDAAYNHSLIKDAFAGNSSAAPALVWEENSHWSAPETLAAEAAQFESEAETTGPMSVASVAEFSDLSPDAIDAIARRVVAQLSDKVVQQIAWEVVPELAELMIKQKLEAR